MSQLGFPDFLISNEMEGDKVATQLQSVGEIPEVKENRRIRRTTLRLREDRFDSAWYRDDNDEELKDVTAESVNLKLGIKMIRVFKPSAKQSVSGVIANVTLDTIVGTIKSIQIRQSNNEDGTIYLTTPSRNVAPEGEDARWRSLVDLSRPVQAQILRYVETLLEEV